jgi:hypothetical protein
MNKISIFILVAALGCIFPGCSTSGSPKEITDQDSILALCKATVRLPRDASYYKAGRSTIMKEGFALFAWFDAPYSSTLPETLELTRSEAVDWIQSLQNSTEFKGKTVGTECQHVQMASATTHLKSGEAFYMTPVAAPWISGYTRLIVYKSAQPLRSQPETPSFEKHIRGILRTLSDEQLYGYIAYFNQDYEFDFLNFASKENAEKAFASNGWANFEQKNLEQFQELTSLNSVETQNVKRNQLSLVKPISLK